jgi:CRP-like cAMP-binding protein
MALADLGDYVVGRAATGPRCHTDGVALLAGLPDEEIRRVLAAARRRRFGRREVLFYEGDPADSLHLIVIGRVAVRVTATLGETATLDVLGPQDVVGELALLAPGGVRAATVVALERVETMVVSASAFATLRQEQPSVDQFLLTLAGRRNRALTSRLVEALYVPADVRVLRRLVDMAAVYGRGDDGEIVILLTQDDLAGLAGTTRETVNRVLHTEAQRGELELGRGSIAVRDLAAITKRAR